MESDNVVGGGKYPSEEDELSDSAGVRDGTRKDPGDDSEVKSIGDNIASRSLSWVNDDMFSLSGVGTALGPSEFCSPRDFLDKRGLKTFFRPPGT